VPLIGPGPFGILYSQPLDSLSRKLVRCTCDTRVFKFNLNNVSFGDFKRDTERG
jgi:hypothetical protein